MTPETADGLLGRMASLDATRAERRVVEYLLSLPESERAILTTKEVCRRTGTSRSTLDRLARRLGHQGFSQLRRSVIREGADALGGVADEPPLDPAIGLEDDPATVAAKVLASVSSRSVAFAQMLAADGRLEHVVHLIDKASRIVLVGAGLSSMVAMDMHHRLLRLGLNVVYSEDVHTQLALASIAGPGDVVMLVSYSGRTRSVIQALTIARERGAHTVALTGNPASSLSRLAEVCITTPPGVGLLGNDAALTRLLQMAFSDVLFHCLALADPHRLERVGIIDEILGPMKVSVRESRTDHVYRNAERHERDN
jgi:DNA-binding MurR/RpiR family transcriptional regulator